MHIDHALPPCLFCPQNPAAEIHNGSARPSARKIAAGRNALFPVRGGGGGGGGGVQGTAVPFLLPLKFEIRSSAIRMRNRFKIQSLVTIKSSPVLAPLSVTQHSALAERGSRDNCLRMLPLNQSERIRAQDVDFTPARLKIYLWRVRLATLGKLFKFSSRLTWRIGMSVACLHFH